MSATAVRALLVVAAVAGIAGMIATSVADSTGGALAFGLVTGGAATALLLVTTALRDRAPADPDLLAEVVEQRVRDLVQAGADESRVRALVADAARLGRH